MLDDLRSIADDLSCARELDGVRTILQNGASYARQLEAAPDGLVALTSGEFELLSCFLLRPRRVLSRDQILDWTHGRSADPFDRTVDLLVSRLRKKLEAASPGSNLISTVRNGGYLLTAPVRPVS